MSASSAEIGRRLTSFRKLQVVVTDPARADISDILVHTEIQWNAKQREAYWRMIDETAGRLAEMPVIGKNHDTLSSFGLRSVPVGRHLLYYWVDGDRLVIARVLYARQDAGMIDWAAVRDEYGKDT